MMGKDLKGLNGLLVGVMALAMAMLVSGCQAAVMTRVASGRLSAESGMLFAQPFAYRVYAIGSTVVLFDFSKDETDILVSGDWSSIQRADRAEALLKIILEEKGGNLFHLKDTDGNRLGYLAAVRSTDFGFRSRQGGDIRIVLLKDSREPGKELGLPEVLPR